MCNGHAAGKDDKVCAAVSALVYALAEYIAESCGGNGDVTLREGYAFLNAEKASKEARGAFKMAAMGLCQLSEVYPDYVHIEMMRGDRL